ncbi:MULTISPECIES: cytochrome c oxidase subunit 4 [unclassified Streptomyces]|jgi:divalent metal cation (Fe/Co/Zn/Cd) transporter|uniref:aa3-type cytochrome oxidase subunit IV n=1 Tax=unclassified Streptomyces TaxID=2593676 RepID=UPI00114D591F|nr:cytochrome c oxidase subunit 4 [Streptomyces sp. SLBN-31]TQJ91938.1 cytochrome c oxidase subunit IV [Streptomyces sp. SLBN-31]
MKAESLFFAGVALFFAGTAVLYGWWAREPAGSAVLAVAFLMAALVSFFTAIQYRRKGRRPQDRNDAEVADAAGPVEFFPPDSPWPVVTALGFAVAALGVVYGLWLFLIGCAVLARGVAGFVFQYVGRGAGPRD